MKKTVVNYFIVIAFIFISAQLSGCGARMNDNPINFEGGNSKTTETDLMSTNQPNPTSGGYDKQEKKSSSPGGNTGGVYDESNNVPPVPPQDKLDVNNEVTEKIPSKIIKTADIKFQVKKYDDSRKKILDMVKQSGAYVQSENQTSSDKSVDNTIVIRIKSDGFDNLVEKLQEESIYTDSKRIVADDVTEQFVDIQARVKS
jgi:hypothetical protein